jgi:hypothetical protein
MAATAAAAAAIAEKDGATVLAEARCTMERAASGAGVSRAWRIADNSIPRALLLLLLLLRPQLDRTAAAVARRLMWKKKARAPEEQYQDSHDESTECPHPSAGFLTRATCMSWLLPPQRVDPLAAGCAAPAAALLKWLSTLR